MPHSLDSAGGTSMPAASSHSAVRERRPDASTTQSKYIGPAAVATPSVRRRPPGGVSSRPVTSVAHDAHTGIASTARRSGT